MNTYKKIAVLGNGAWGTTIANHLAIKGEGVYLWGREQAVLESIKRTKYNDIYLPGIKLSSNLSVEEDRKRLLYNADIVVMAIPVQYLRRNIEEIIQDVNSSSIIINLGKGLEQGSLYRPSEVIASLLKKNRHIGALSGPNLAFEVARQKKSKSVLSIPDYHQVDSLKSVFGTNYFRVDVCDDLVGVEIGGALKNVVALAAGICDGLGLEANTKACLVTQGMREITLIGVTCGARLETFMSISGLGDLLATCYSPESRNRRFGYELGQGKTVEEAAHSLGLRVAEGVETALAAYNISRNRNCDTPLIDRMYEVIFCNDPPDSIMRSVFNNT